MLQSGASQSKGLVMNTQTQSTTLGRIAITCSITALLATLILLPLIQQLPEHSGFLLFLVWIGLALGGSVSGIVLGGFRVSSQAIRSKTAVIIGCSAALLFLAALVYPAILLALQSH